MTGGRPLRFLALTLGGWVAIRMALLLPDAPLPSIARTLAPMAGAAPRQFAVLPARRTRVPTAVRTRRDTARRMVQIARAEPVPRPPEGVDPSPSAPPDRGVQFVPSPSAPPTPVRSPGRFGGSVWLLARGGGGGTLSGGQLGASQAGVRVTYALDDRRRLALAARIAAPLHGLGREAALGVEWQPSDLPIRLIAEQRFALDGGRGGPTLGVIGGYGPADIVRGVRFEAYGQAGAIHRAGIEGFVDASARVAHPVIKLGGARVDIGVGVWGSAQRGAARFDLGPSVAVTMPVIRKSVRLTLDWRHRIAGRARPGSGPALSIGSDF